MRTYEIANNSKTEDKLAWYDVVMSVEDAFESREPISISGEHEGLKFRVALGVGRFAISRVYPESIDGEVRKQIEFSGVAKGDQEHLQGSWPYVCRFVDGDDSMRLQMSED